MGFLGQRFSFKGEIKQSLIIFPTKFQPLQKTKMAEVFFTKSSKE